MAYIKYNKRDEDTGFTENEQTYIYRMEMEERKKQEAEEIKASAYDPKGGDDTEWVYTISDERLYEVYGEFDEETISAKIEMLRKQYVADMGAFEGQSAYSSYNSGMGRGTSPTFRTQFDAKASAERKMENSKRMFENVYYDVVIEPALKHYFGERPEYKHSHGLPFVEFQNVYTNLYGEKFNLMLNKFDAEDYIKGTFAGHTFRQSDIRLSGKQAARKLGGRVMTLEGYYPVGDDMYIGLRDSDREIYSDNQEFNDYTTGDLEFDEKFIVRVKDSAGAEHFLTPDLIDRLKKLEVGGDSLFYVTPTMLWVFRDRIRGMFEMDINSPIDIVSERRYTCLAFDEAVQILGAVLGDTTQN